MVYVPNITEGSLTRAAAADPNGQRCLIENCSKMRAVQLAHVLPRSLSGDDSLMSRLEWSWKMRQGTLNLDTRQNVVFVGASFRLLLERGQWGLLPEEHILDKFLECGHFFYREKFPDLTDEVFTYTFIPIEDMEDSLENHIYPFHTFPKLTSHIHPKFAVFALGRWFDHARGESRAAVYKQWPTIRKVVSIWARWMKAVPPSGLSDPTYVDPNAELVDESENEHEMMDDCESDGDSISTRPRRIPYPPPKRRQHPPPSV
ncbi:hypothetical protein BKA70DRAFT_1494232 [Coprinopsis sp. MPI-PUGE-AT-0042]|nr:hypothetical protein BKA70DRAFT_1494232 [Coprinopsis sp. MPI-PUGE-AT-0042]